MGELSFAAVFVAGVLSFSSPCVVALVPAYVSYVSGVAVSDLGESSNFGKIMLNALLFCVGFTVIFVTLGASASIVGGFMQANRLLLARVGGAVIVLFGLHVLGLLRIPFLNREVRPMFGKIGGGSYLQSPFVGMSFAIGWTPCLGTILGSILVLASQTATLGQGALLLGVYSLGLTLPFLAVAAALSKGLDLSFIKTNARKIEVASGLLLVAFGLLIFTGQLTLLTQRLIG